MIGLVSTLVLAIQAPTSVPSDTARPTRLDALLTAHDYTAMTRTILAPPSPADAVSDLAWLRDRMLAGKTALVSILYARRLWETSPSLPPEQRETARQTAVTALLYTFGASMIDGERCGDATAPSHVRDGIARWLPGVGAYVRRLSPDVRSRLVDQAVVLEARTAPRRDKAGDVDFLCRNGLEETQYDLKHGPQREVPSAPGQIGRTVILQGDGTYRPSLRADAVWKPLAAADRARLRAMLTRMVSPAPAAAPDPAPPPHTGGRIVEPDPHR